MALARGGHALGSALLAGGALALLAHRKQARRLARNSSDVVAAVSGSSNKVGDNSQDLEDANYNLPSPVRSNVDGNWKRKKKNRLGKKARQSVFKRLGKKNIY